MNSFNVVVQTDVNGPRATQHSYNKSIIALEYFNFGFININTAIAVMTVVNMNTRAGND